MELELNKIYNENCLDTMSKMSDEYIDMVVTSPPYDNIRDYENNIDKSWGEHVWKPIIKELYRVIKQGGVVVWIVSDATINGTETGTSFRQCIWAQECGFNIHDTMIWVKDGGGAIGSNNCYTQNFEYMFVWSKGVPKSINLIKDKYNKSAGKSFRGLKRAHQPDRGDGSRKVVSGEWSRRNNWWYLVPHPNDETFDHPAPYPESLAGDHIKSWSVPGDIIYDPFMGSGTTGKMAHLLERKFIGSELNTNYYQKATERLNGYLAQEALFSFEDV